MEPLLSLLFVHQITIMQSRFRNPFALKSYIIFLLIPIALLHAPAEANAQRFNTAGEYMSYIGDKYTNLSLKFYRYMSAVAHSNSARKVEKTRAELLTTSWDTYTEVRTLPLFKGNRSLRDSAASFLKINHRIIKEDYDRILDMEVISRESYSGMEAYLIARKQARNKLDVANIKMLVEQKKFAAEHNLQLEERKDEMYQKMQEANAVLDYLNTIYLLFYLSHSEEILMIESIGTKSESQLDKHANRLWFYAVDGLEKLDVYGDFKGDNSLENACRYLLNFYKSEGEKDRMILLDYFKAEDTFAIDKIVYDQSIAEERTEEFVDKYNQSVRRLNQAATLFNNTNTGRQQQRDALLENWRNAYDVFLSRHIPKF